MRRFLPVIALVAVTALAGCTSPGEEFSVQHLGGDSSSTTTTATEVTTSSVPECGESFVTKLDENRKNKVLSNGVQAATSEEMRQEILDFNSQDPRGLFLYYNASPLAASSPISDVTSLVEGSEVRDGVCFSEEGMQKYSEWSTLWKVSQIEDAQSMPSGWGNTGVSNGTPTSGAAPTGNTEGWIIIFVDVTGKEIGRHGVMKRCGNPVTPKPVAPQGPTDEPGPEETTTTTIPGGKDHRKSPVSRADPNDSDLRDDPVVPGGGDTKPGGTTTTTSTIPDRGTPGSGTDGSGQPLPPGGDKGISEPKEEPNPPPPDNPPVTGEIDCASHPDNPVCG